MKKFLIKMIVIIVVILIYTGLVPPDWSGHPYVFLMLMGMTVSFIIDDYYRVVLGEKE